MRRFVRFIKNKRGATAIEYGLIVALIAITAVGGMNFLAGRTTGMWNHVSTTLDNAIE